MLSIRFKVCSCFVQRLSGRNDGGPRQLPQQKKFLKTTNISAKDSQNKIHWTSKGCQILLKALIVNKLVHALFVFEATAAIRAAPLPEPSSDNIRVMLACGKISSSVSSM